MYKTLENGATTGLWNDLLATKEWLGGGISFFADLSFFFSWAMPLLSLFISLAERELTPPLLLKKYKFVKK